MLVGPLKDALLGRRINLVMDSRLFTTTLTVSSHIYFWLSMIGQSRLLGNIARRAAHSRAVLTSQSDGEVESL